MAEKGLIPLAAAAFLASACAKELPPPPEGASQTMIDFTMTQTAKGARIWTLVSPRARVTLEGAAVLEKPEIKFYRKGQHASTARSKTASVRGDGKDVALVGEVVIIAPRDQTTLRTERLDYDSKTERFRTDDAVVVERPDAVLRGRGLETDAALTDITIYKQETRIRQEPKKR